MVNTIKIRELMRAKRLSYEDLGQKMGLQPTTVKHKVYNIRPLKLSEAQIIQEALGITDDEFGAIFLVPESHSATND